LPPPHVYFAEFTAQKVRLQKHGSAHARLARGAVPVSSTALHSVSPAPLAPGLACNPSRPRRRARLIHGAAFGLARGAASGHTPDSAPDPSLGLAASR